MACEEELLAGNLQVEGGPGKASDAAKQTAQKLLGLLKCFKFSPMDLHNEFPNLLRVSVLCSRQSTALPLLLSSCRSPTGVLHTRMRKGTMRRKSVQGQANY